MACKLNKGANMAEQPGTVEQTEQTQNTASPTQTGQGSTTTTQNTISNEELKKQLDIIDEKVSKHNSFVLNSFEASFDFASEEEKDINLADGLTVPNAKKISRKVDEKIAQVDTKISQVDTKIEEFESYKLDKTLELDETKAKVQSVEDTLNTKANINGSENQTFKVREAQLEDEATPLKQVNLKLAQIKGELKGELKTELIDNLGQGSESRRFRVANATEGKDAVNLELLNQRLLTVQGSGGSGTIDPEVLNSKANLGGNENQKFRVANAVEDNEAVNKAQLEEVKTIAEQRALLEGSETQTFKVANAVEDNEAVNFGQMSTSILTKANIGGSASQIFKVADATEPNDAVNLKVLNQKIGLAGGVEAIQEDIITRNFSDDSAVGFMELSNYHKNYLTIITKKGDLIDIPHKTTYRNIKQNVNIKKTNIDNNTILYKDGQLICYSTKTLFISDNVEDFFACGPYIIYTKVNDSKTYIEGIGINRISLGEVIILDRKVDCVSSYSQDNDYIFLLKSGSNMYYNTVYRTNFPSSGNRDLTKNSSLFDNLTNVKECFEKDDTFYVLTTDGKIKVYRRDRERNRPIYERTLETLNDEKVVTIFQGTIFQGYKYTNKKRLMLINSELSNNTEYRYAYNNVELSHLKYDYGIPIIEQNSKKYVLSLDFIQYLSHYLDSADRGRFILNDNFPSKDNIFKTIAMLRGNLYLAYINKQGEVYAAGYNEKTNPRLTSTPKTEEIRTFTKVYPFN